MPLSPPILQTSLPRRAPDRHGKVRDIYVFGDRLLIVATDRISAFDYVLGSGIPDKGKILTQISAFWFEHTRGIVANHVLSTRVADFPAEAQAEAAALAGRSMLVRRTEPLPIECVARGYLSGSAWKDVPRHRRGVRHRAAEGAPGVGAAARADLHTATKAESGHDVNSREAAARELVGAGVLARARDLTLQLYAKGAPTPRPTASWSATQKFEFGLLPPDGTPAADAAERLILIDEVLTPDSSRFWPRRGTRRADRNQASTNNSSATTSRRSSGTSSRRSPRCPTMWWPRPGRNTWRRSTA